MTNGNDYAFAPPTYFGDGSTMTEPLTKREYFAAMAMQGLLSDYRQVEDIGNCAISLQQSAVILADALIEALNAEAK